MKTQYPKILLVEDDPDLGNVLSQYLRMNQYSVALARNGKDGLKLFQESSFNLCILDVMMPEMDGFALAAHIKRKNNLLPIVFLTARKLHQDRIQGLQLGADDYITKPFEPEELILRVRNILRRTGVQNEISVKLGNYIFETSQFKLKCDKWEKQLTEREAVLLNFFLDNKNIVIKRSEILKAVWGEDDFFLGRSMDVFITRLRKYLSKDNRIQLKSVRGVGIMLEINE